MSFLTLLAALMLERFRPLPRAVQADRLLAHLADFLESRFNAGERRHGLIAWLLGIGGLVLLSGGLTLLLDGCHPLLGGLWNVALLYWLIDFRRANHFFTEIQIALRMDNLPQARRMLGEWQESSAESFSATDIARVAIERLTEVAHRHIFAPLTWFLLIPGPIGPIVYRAAGVLAGTWSTGRFGEADHFGEVARQTFAIIDWLPLRLSAVILAVAGDFESAMYSWRAQIDKWHASDMGIVLAAMAGTLGVRLRVRPAGSGDRVDRGRTDGDDADVDIMESAVGLIWRALMWWLLLSLLLGLANLVGG
ncbi:MAG TPA: CobD/CbiB family protein [Accumulibacter sp.]|nr:CobD/CbiB family protein [Accumulibacter sp.]HMW17342.1 CobD/CbiB family protein [Accumulibacter sp.]HMX22372.1 CobD/CbiB family protein [Accumulibacter sp.]HMY05980.1 CobD/CbiB family protein [Accumulibacter sp.]HNC17153.1 CobD/CbiB family protein [Accumulibacter sp.]